MGKPMHSVDQQVLVRTTRTMRTRRVLDIDVAMSRDGIDEVKYEYVFLQGPDEVKCQDFIGRKPALANAPRARRCRAPSYAFAPQQQTSKRTD